jgi:transcriptional regulator with XRE-family HTH domain
MDDDANRRFSERLIHAMEENGQAIERGAVQALANGAGISMSMASRFISGKTIPSKKTVKKIAVWLRVNPWWLLYGERAKLNDPIQRDGDLDKDLFSEIMRRLAPRYVGKDVSQAQIDHLVSKTLGTYNNLKKESKENQLKILDILGSVVESLP